ncbi:Ger(x)C family spore germination protein [Paenibacillus sp. FSL L8-0470]|uniref:Ger(x)C family spore germination protein n=1 Tax=unclassified Paenibacillus TaxID=185978 RepID=UPI0030F6E5D3
MNNKLFISMTVLLLLTGCESDERILEKLGMVQTSGYDLLENSKLKVTSCVPVIDPNSAIRRELLTAEVNSIKEARLHFSRQTDLKVVSGQLRESMFGAKLAKAGVEDYIDTLLRDPSIALGVRVTVVEGDAGELLTKNFKPHTDTGRYITHMLEKEAAGNSIPATTFYEFSRDYNDEGIDPVAPIVKDDGNKVLIDGIALFQEDRYVTKVSAKDGIIFGLFRDDLRQGEIAINLGQEDGKQVVVMFSSLLNKRKIKVHHLGDGRFKIDLSASIKGSVLEYTGKQKLNEEKDRKELEKQISEYITAKAQKMVQQMQQYNVDSLGIGVHVRNSLSYKKWKALNWREVYPEIEVECQTKVTIKDYGKYS